MRFGVGVGMGLRLRRRNRPGVSMLELLDVQPR